MATPTVTSVDVPAGGTYTTGQVLEFIVHFDQAVTVGTGGGTPKINLTFDTGGLREAPYVSGSGSTALTFRYTITGGDQDPNGITVGAMSANGGTLRNAGSEDAAVALNNVGSTASVLVNAVGDVIAPVVNSVSVPANGTYAAGQNLDFTVNFSETVTVNTAGGAPRIALTLDTGGTVYATYVSGSGTSALTFRYTVQSGQSDANGVTVGALSANGGTIRDAASNDAVTTLNSVGSTAAVLVDGVVDISIAAASANKAEGSGGGTTAFTFLLTRDNTTGAASVDYAVAGSGGSPANAVDFGGTLPGGTASFADGEATKTLTFYVAADSTVETNEGFTVTLSNPTNLTIGTASAAGQIVNDDTAPANSTPLTQAGGFGPESMAGVAGADSIAAGAGGDDVRGMDGDDSVDGEAGDDTVNGNGGADTVNGGDGADFVFGGRDNDSVHGGAGDDAHVNGNRGADTVHGGDGADTVYGGKDNDSVYGDAGDDRVSGDMGDDVLFGGAGADRFAFRKGFGQDLVMDFDAGAGDRIELAGGQAYTVAQVGGQTVIDLGGGDVITLSGVSSFSAGWIVFG